MIAFSRSSLYTFFSRNPTYGTPPCLRISKRKYLPMPSEFHNREPPLPFGNPKSRPWYRYGYFLESPNEESDEDMMGGSTKTVQHSIKNISRNIGAVFFKLGTRNVHHKRNIMTPTMSLPIGNTLGSSLFP